MRRLIVSLRELGHEVMIVTADEDARLPEVELQIVKLTGNRTACVIEFDRRIKALTQTLAVDCLFSLERLGEQDVLRAGDGVHATWLEQRRMYAPLWRRWLLGRGGFHRSMMALEARSFDSRNTGHIIVNSDMVGRDIYSRFGYPTERIHLVRNGVEMNHWRGGEREATRRLWGVEPENFLLLFAGSGWERKGLRYVLSAMDRLIDKNLRLVVAGKGSPPQKIRPEVHFVGTMEAMENAYAAADLFIFPPIYEPSANVCFEALAAGLPVVTSACNGASEVIEEGVNGTVIANPSDVEALVTAIKFWRERPEEQPVPVKADLSLDRNVRETMDVLMLAARERVMEQS